MRTLRTQITILFTTFLVVALILFTLFFNGAVDKLFEMYANEQRQKQVQQIQEQINDSTAHFGDIMYLDWRLSVMQLYKMV